MFPPDRFMIRIRVVVAIAALFVLAGCRAPQKMASQPSYKPYEGSNFFEDGMSSRLPVQGTVARGTLVADPYLATGKINNVPGDAFPFEITAERLKRGQERFDIYCSMCHGRTGYGNGMIVQRGYTRPPSFHSPEQRTRTAGHYFDVITNGFGVMPPYASQVPVEDRWAIAAYIKVLQLSQNATVNDVPVDKRAQLR